MKKFFSFKIKIILAALLFVASSVFFASLSSASGEEAVKTYVLTAGKWGKFQDSAAIMAGGTVTFSHKGTGVGVVKSSAPDFLEKALASRAFTDGAEDMMIEWQPPTEVVQFDQASVTPGDETFFFMQWHLGAIEAEAAWDAGYTGDGVRIAILDGGMPADHIDIAPNLDFAASASFVPGLDFDQDSNTFRHAGHVAGIAAAPDNGMGTIGVAPDATIIGVKVLDGGSGYFSWLIEGIEYASRSLAEGGAGADIINMSLAGVVCKNGGAGPLVGALNKIITTATRRGVLVISAAGNNGFNFDHSWDCAVLPAESGNGIAISATGPLGWALGETNFRRPASYTNHGNSLVHVAAPGGDYALPGDDLCTVGFITHYCWVLDMVFSVYSGTSSYGWAAGTSMAAPVVAGVAALVKERYPGITVGQWKNILANSADDEGKKGHDPFYGRGFINARRAVTE